MVFIPSLILASTIALTSFTPGAGAAAIPMPMDHAAQRPMMRQDTRMDKRAPGLVVSPKYDVHHSQHWNYHHGYVNKDGHGHGPPHRRSENSARNYKKNGHKSHKSKPVADIQVRSHHSDKKSKPALEIKVLKRHDHDEHRHHGDHWDHSEHRHHDKRDLEPRHDHDHDHYDHDRHDERYGHYDHNGHWHYDHHKVKRAEVEPRHDHDDHYHHGHYDEHYHHHHDKREDNTVLTKRSTVMVEPASQPAIAARDHRDEHYDHHRHHGNHHHHARSEEEEETSDLEARHKSEKGAKKGKGESKKEGSHHKGGKEHKGKGKGGKRSIFEKRGLAPAGVPGFVEVASPLFNSTLARSIAGLVFSANPDTSANASAFILGTSSSQSTQFYLSASTASPITAVTGALTGPNVVNIRIPILNSQALTTTDFCATFDLSPPSPLSLLPCGSIPGYSQDFAYNSTTSELQPLYAASAPAPMAMVDTTGGKMQTSKNPAKSFAAAASPATPAPEQEAPQAISLYFVPASTYYQPPVAVQALFASNNAATTTNSTSTTSNSTASSTVASSGPPSAPMADGAMDGNTPDAQDSTMEPAAPAATASPAAASNNAPPAASAASTMPPMSMAGSSSPSPAVQTVTMTSTAVTTATATPAAAAPPAQTTMATSPVPTAAATPLSTSTVGPSTMMVQGTTNAMKFAKW